MTSKYTSVDTPPLRIGITGQSGFMGTHLFNSLSRFPGKYKLLPFSDEFFTSDDTLRNWVSGCDVIVHLAALNRHCDPQVIYDTNLKLVCLLIAALEAATVAPQVIFSSSSQEEFDNSYGRSKRKGRELFLDWAKSNHGKFTGMVIPNVFGPFGHPYYNSVIATFCYQLTHNEQPKIETDALMKLIYIDELAEEFRKVIDMHTEKEYYSITHTSEKRVSEILRILMSFKEQYFEKGIIPGFHDRFELQLFNTFRCYMDIRNYFPVNLPLNIDNRGSFVETIKAETGGQTSVSITLPGIIRGQHFHTRKIERFVVICGKARIQLRRVGTSEVMDFELSGDTPSYVDMPVWYTHNIMNIGEDELYTLFWTNEMFDPNDPDTYFEKV